MAAGPRTDAGLRWSGRSLQDAQGKQVRKKNPVRGGGLTGLVGGGNEGKEETSFRFDFGNMQSRCQAVFEERNLRSS